MLHRRHADAAATRIRRRLHLQRDVCDSACLPPRNGRDVSPREKAALPGRVAPHPTVNSLRHATSKTLTKIRPLAPPDEIHGVRPLLLRLRGVPRAISAF